MQPAISIIVPVYNLEAYVSKCLDSILTQTLENIEIIVVNDGSNDQSGEISDHYAKKDGRIKVIHKDYGGVSSARNVGVKAANGEYIGFVDGDDYIEPDMYEKLLLLCKSNNCDISVCHLGREIDGNLVSRTDGKIEHELSHIEAMREL